MNLIKTATLCVSLIFGLAFNCAAQQQVNDVSYEQMLDGLLKRNVSETTVNSLKEKEGSVVLLDAREKAEYDVSHLKDATWTGYDTFKFSRIKDVPKDAEIVVYCSVGYRSEVITRKLMKKGYTNVSNLYGGIFEWVNSDGEVVNTADEVTPKVHAYDKTWGEWLKKGEKVY